MTKQILQVKIEHYIIGIKIEIMQDTKNRNEFRYINPQSQAQGKILGKSQQSNQFWKKEVWENIITW